MRITRYASALLALALPFVACGPDDRPIQPLGQSNAITAETAPTNPPSTSVVTVEPTPQPTVEITTTTEAPPTTEAVPVTRPVRTVPTVVEVPRTVDGDVWAALAHCESGMTNADTGNGYYGYFQFLPSTWRSVGEVGLPTDYGYSHQRAAAQTLQARSGWGQWPACSRALGLR
jgi:hypothetical protein